MIDLRDLSDLREQEIRVQELRLPASLHENQAALQRRRAAALALDPLVRRTLSLVMPGLPAPTIDATIYDAVYPAYAEAGAHWTAASLMLSFLTHSVWSYTVTLLFDEHDQPSRFAVHAAQDAVSDGVSESALREAIARARQRGPLQTHAPHLFANTGI